MKKLIVFFTLISAFAALAVVTDQTKTISAGGEWDTIDINQFETDFKTVSDFYNGLTRFSVKVEHASYKGKSTLNPHEKAKGFFVRDGKNYRSDIMGIQTIQNSQFKIVVDTSGKTILVAVPDQLELTEVTSLNYLLSRNNTSTVSYKKEGNNKRYKLGFRTGTYLEYEILVSAEGAIKEIVFLFRNKYAENPNDKNSEKVNPRAVISYSDLNKSPVISKSEFDVSKYVTIPEKGIPTGVNAYKNYQVYDTRFDSDQLKK